MMACRIFLLLIFLPLFFSHCSKTPTEAKGVSLSGFVKLEGQSNHSGTTVALYDLAEVDTMVVRLNKEFHTVGIPISQVTEFDHRTPKPICQTQTKANGSYKLEGIEVGVHNLVAVWLS